jgi:glycosyltransferase involved in cell wall biosynthesis
VRIGLLTTSFPRWPGDVAGHFVHGFAHALAARGHTLQVLAPEPAERVAVEPADWLGPGVELCWLPYLRPRALQRTFYGAGVPDNLRSDPRAWLGPLPFSVALAAAVRARRERWDALVSHFGLPCGVIAGALRQGRPHLCVQHSADLHALARLPRPVGTRLAARIAQGASALWFVSERARAGFLQPLPEPLHSAAHARSLVSPMGVASERAPDEARAALRARLGIERFALLTLARLVPVKGLPAAVRALAGRADLEWLIAGEGPERAELEALARSSALRVRLLGHVSGADKVALLHAADAFVLPSRVLASGRSEGAPTAVLEAMAAGLPVIASAVGGIGELVLPGETGWLFVPEHPGALQAAVDRVLHAPELAQGVAAAARVLAERHAWSALAPRIEAALRPAVGATSAPHVQPERGDPDGAKPAAALGAVR